MKFRILLLNVLGLSLLVQGQDPLQVPMSEPATPTPAVVEKAVPVNLPEPEPTPAPTPLPTPTPEPQAVPEGITVTVLGDRVNLRNDATTESDVVGQANYGDVLAVQSITDTWVEVTPPASLNVWVYSPLLFEDREVRAQSMNTRSGPGTQFARLGPLTRGTPVKVLETLGDWRRIEVPETITLWISRDFVQVPPALEKKSEPAPVPTPVPVPTPMTIVEVRTIERIVEVPVKPTPEPDLDVEGPEGLDLVPLRGQGMASRRRGFLRAYLLAGNNPSRFNLEREDGSTLCYLIGEKEVLEAAAGQTVQVSGRDYWVTSEKLPVMNIETIKILDEGVQP